jgi:hypothetical protein
LVTPKVDSVTKNAALRMIPSLDKAKAFALSQNTIAHGIKPPQVGLRQEAGPRIRPDQLLNGPLAVSEYHRKNLLGYGKNFPRLFSGETIVKEPGLVRSVDILLGHDGHIDLAKVVAPFSSGFRELESAASLRDIGL